jgi:transposase-like protein
MLKVIDNEHEDHNEFKNHLDAVIRQGAQRMLAAALQAEVEAYIGRHTNERDEEGRRLVVSQRYGGPKTITTGAGPVEVEAPRVNDKRVVDGERQKFTSVLLPPYMRRSPKVDEVLPLLYLRGLSTNDFRPALEALLGDRASGLSATTITRLTAQWEGEHKTWRTRDLSERDYVYVWADGIHLNIRLEEDRLCLLVIIGVRPDGTKELVAVEDGYRESSESWSSVLRSLRDRGMRAPVLAVGDGALGFWAALRDVWPETKEQRCWFHKMGNVIDKLPKRLQPKAKKLLREIVNADSRDDAEEAIAAFESEFAPKHQRAVDCLAKDGEKLLTLYEFPAEHWKHLRTTNVIESSFATVRLRQRVTKGAGSRTKGLAMAFKLLDMAQARWRKLNGSELLPLVRAGVKFVDGIRQERDEEDAA